MSYPSFTPLKVKKSYYNENDPHNPDMFGTYAVLGEFAKTGRYIIMQLALHGEYHGTILRGTYSLDIFEEIPEFEFMKKPNNE